MTCHENNKIVSDVIDNTYTAFLNKTYRVISVDTNKCCANCTMGKKFSMRHQLYKSISNIFIIISGPKYIP